MTQNLFNPSDIVESQIPSFIRDNNPLFVKFMQYYYQFVEQSNIQSITQNVLQFNDIDQVEMQYLQTFFEEFNSIPQSIAADPRLVAKHIYDLYKSKGTPTAVKLLFQILFGEQVDVTFPSSNVLRSSVGNWVVETVFSLQILSGGIISTTDTIQLTSIYGTQNFPIIFMETTPGSAELRVYAELNSSFNISSVTAQLYSSSTGSLDATTTMEHFPSSINIINPGSNWKVNQLVIFPASGLPTIAQITSVNQTGGITGLQIVQHGQATAFISTIDTRLTTIQTLFNVTYSVGYIDIYVNGVRLSMQDYSATTGNTVTIFSETHVGDLVEFVVFSKIQTRTIFDFVATASQTAFTLTSSHEYIDVYRNGVKIPMSQFSIAGNVITLDTPAEAGQIVEFVCYDLTTGTRTTEDTVLTAGQTTVIATYIPNYTDFYVNGIKISPLDYTATDGNTVILNLPTPVAAGSTLEIVSYNVASENGNYVVSPYDKQPVSIPIQPAYYTEEEWNNSKATLAIEYSNYATAKGYFANDNGMLSDTNMRLEDSFFYQTFSYLIKSQHQIPEFQNVIKLIHPAGTIYFAETDKETDITVPITVNRILD